MLLLCVCVTIRFRHQFDDGAGLTYVQNHDVKGGVSR